jgi:hypothetical protein
VLSAIAGAVLEPLNPGGFDPDDAATVELYNIVAALTVATQLSTCLYSTFTLYLHVTSSHDPKSAYCVALHMQSWLGCLEISTYIPALGTYVLIVLAVYLNCSKSAYWIVLFGTCAIFGTAQIGFTIMMWSAFPYIACVVVERGRLRRPGLVVKAHGRRRTKARRANAVAGQGGRARHVE